MHIYIHSAPYLAVMKNRVYLKHMIRLFPQAIRKAKAVEDLDTAALQPVGLTIEDFCAALVDDSCFDAEACHPCCEHETRWASADDEDIDVVGADCHGCGSVQGCV